jgi:creatinine amidohydrolase
MPRISPVPARRMADGGCCDTGHASGLSRTNSRPTRCTSNATTNFWRRAMAEIEWRRLRADQLRDMAVQDAIVILPVASLEQHGPHLPVEVDSLLGEIIAARTAFKVSARGKAVVVLPVLWSGLSEHHMSFGGTVTLDVAVFAGVVEGVVRSVLRHGFRRIVLLNAHGGNENALRVITDELTPKLGVPIVQLTYWYAAAVAIAKILETQGGVQHACEAETSMMMAARPDLVATDRIALARSNITAPELGGGVYRWRPIASRSDSGVIGNPEAASAEKGERLFDAISDALAVKLCHPDLWR